MLKKLRGRLEEIRRQKHKHFHDFQPLIMKIANAYDFLFPNFKENTSGSHYVYNFGVAELFPFTVVKEHGGRDCQSPKAAKRVIEAIEDVLSFVEANIPDDQESESEGDPGDERPVDVEETPGALPEPKVPDGDCGG
jgi:hypothetical protein